MALPKIVSLSRVSAHRTAPDESLVQPLDKIGMPFLLHHKGPVSPGRFLGIRQGKTPQHSAQEVWIAGPVLVLPLRPSKEIVGYFFFRRLSLGRVARYHQDGPLFVLGGGDLRLPGADPGNAVQGQCQTAGRRIRLVAGALAPPGLRRPTGSRLRPRRFALTRYFRDTACLASGTLVLEFSCKEPI